MKKVIFSAGLLFVILFGVGCKSEPVALLRAPHGCEGGCPVAKLAAEPLAVKSAPPVRFEVAASGRRYLFDRQQMYWRMKHWWDHLPGHG